jgi:predicted nucleic acid-binding protein
MRFFDASAIVAAYTNQANTARARELLASSDVAVSRLSQVETTSAFARLGRERRSEEERRDAAIAAFLDDLDGWYIVELTAEVAARARDLLVRHALRAADAIQLASALEIQTNGPVPLDAFVAYDRRLADAARRERLTVIED